MSKAISVLALALFAAAALPSYPQAPRRPVQVKVATQSEVAAFLKRSAEPGDAESDRKPDGDISIEEDVEAGCRKLASGKYDMLTFSAARWRMLNASSGRVDPGHRACLTAGGPHLGDSRGRRGAQEIRASRVGTVPFRPTSNGRGRRDQSPAPSPGQTRGPYLPTSLFRGSLPRGRGAPTKKTRKQSDPDRAVAANRYPQEDMRVLVKKVAAF